jgi:hypothetical protein
MKSLSLLPPTFLDMPEKQALVALAFRQWPIRLRTKRITVCINCSHVENGRGGSSDRPLLLGILQILCDFVRISHDDVVLEVLFLLHPEKCVSGLNAHSSPTSF